MAAAPRVRARRGRTPEARDLVAIVRRFSRARLLVVGDLMLDQFISGRVSRISPEAPVPVVQVTGESFHLGGAANVAANIRALGGPAAIAGVIGTDAPGGRLTRDLRSIGVGVSRVVRGASYPTIRKIRILAHQQQVVRLDREPRSLDERLTRKVTARVLRSLHGFDGIVVSDYNKGVVSRALLEQLGKRTQGKPMLFIDPKKGNFQHCVGATLVKPNLEAASLASGIEIVDERSLAKAGERLLEQWRCEAVLISRGEEGMTLFRRNRRMEHFPTAAREVYDVTGAGDTALATVALALAAGATFEDAAVLANRAAGIVVGKLGTATASAEELIADLRKTAPA
ncbi:MAG TPA: D-glycero-beta-D-manno-heptose-7-phosphate kinase [Candidatus Binatia bacterium]|nr:D-glycero-beta-D-manno-heptose-7-phosphate kinase [Candidatus Binatia bacterium]